MRYMRRISAALERCRAGEGPTLIEAKTYRYRGHSRTDPAKYRAEGELERWQERDPIVLLGANLAADGLLDEQAQQALREEVQSAVDAAADEAARRTGSDPRGDRGLCLRRLRTQAVAQDAGTVEMSYREAICAALEDELAADADDPADGRGRRDGGGVFKTNEGLPEKFGTERIRNTPICENGFIGARSAWPSPDCGRSSRSCSATSSRPPATRSSTSCPSSASCPAASARCRSPCARSAAGRAGSGRSTRRRASRGTWRSRG